MKFDLGVGESKSEVLEQAYRTAYGKLNITLIDILDGAKEWSMVKQEVSRIMSMRLKGRTKIIKQVRITPSREGYKYHLSGLFRGIYPPKLKTNKAKFKYLKGMKEEGMINQEIYLDLGSVLGYTVKELFKCLK